MTKMRVLVWLGLCFAAVSAASSDSSRIVGGSLTTIENYPSMAAVLTFGLVYRQGCGGTILNQRSILSAAHCFLPVIPVLYRVRIGSSYSNSGGTVHNVNSIIRHPEWHDPTTDNDVALLHSATFFVYSNVVQPAPIAGPNYFLADDTAVWATGWGSTYEGGPLSEQLRDVQIWTVNHDICNQRYGGRLTENMLCAGWLDVGGRDQCVGDSGGPLYHNGVVVGVCSFGVGCAEPRHPGVNARVSRFATWIQANA